MKISHSLLLRSLARIARAGLGAILFAGIQFTVSSGFCTDPPAVLTVAVDVGEGQSIVLESQRGLIGTISLPAGEARQLVLQFPPDKAGKPLIIATYDGGEIGQIGEGVDSVPNCESGSFPILPLTFQANEPGLYRVLVLLDGEHQILRFRVK